MKIEEDKNQLIGRRIKEARESADKSQKELADILGFESATAISLIESGERKIKAEDLEKVANFLHRDVKFFLGMMEDAADVRFALRSDKDLSSKDQEEILNFIEFVKRKKR